eukprot:scaffold17792_cov146-Amphora_coffeaeformis.AAC.3
MTDHPLSDGDDAYLPVVVELPIPSPGARWTYAELEDAFPPQPPVPEERHCTIYPALTTTRPPTTKKSSKTDNEEEHTLPIPTVTSLRRADNPSWVYHRLSTKPTIPLDHHAKGWGKIWFAVAAHSATTTSSVAVTTDPSSPHQPGVVGVVVVAVKELSKAVVTDYLL